MRMRVDARIRLQADEVPPRLLERLRHALTFPNPAYLDRLRLGLGAAGEPETLCFLRDGQDEVSLPRGAVHTLRNLAAAEGIILSSEDRRRLPAGTLPPLPELPLRDYQRDAVERLARVTQGTVVIPCGGGKTVVGLGAIRRIGTPALVLVHTLDLAEQWREQLRTRLGVEAGLVGDGVEEPREVTVAVIQALSRWQPPRLESFLAGFGLLILDEAHHVAAATFHTLVDRCPARYRLGLTATPEREDGLTALLELFLGQELVHVTHGELVAAGVLAVPEVQVVPTAFTYPYHGAEDFGAMMGALAADPARNSLIAETVARDADAGHVCLVLSARVDHCELLAGLLRDKGLAAEVLCGKVPRKRRTELLQQARAGELRVLLATSVADEGLDLPRLSRVYLAFPGRARGRTTQRLGRLMRPHPEKLDAALVDFVDRQVPILRRQHIDRRQLYAEVLGVPASRLSGPRPARGAAA